MAKIKENSSVGEDVKQMEFSCLVSRRINWCNNFRKLVISTKAQHIPTLWSSHSTPRNIPNRNASKDVYRFFFKMSPSSMNVIAKHWNQHKCLSTVDWIYTLWNIRTGEHCTTVRMNELKLHATIWVNLVNIMVERKKPDAKEYV